MAFSEGSVEGLQRYKLMLIQTFRWVLHVEPSILHAIAKEAFILVKDLASIGNRKD